MNNPAPYDPEIFEIEVELILEAIFRKYKTDFRGYSRASVHRRIRQALIQLNTPTVSRLQESILNHAEAFDRLMQLLTISTSEMFRDPEYFRAIRDHLVPHLRTYPSVKVWIAGCSTGEELYSMAILFHEEKMEERVQFYATDINPVSLKSAEEGVFQLDHVQKFTKNYQLAGGKASFSDYYQAGYGSAVFKKGLRSNVVFADHSLATDNVFSEVEFISCRNVLIYFNRPLQDRAFNLFYDSLGNRGFLGLGSKESLHFSSVADRFDAVAAQQKIYRKQGSFG